MMEGGSNASRLDKAGLSAPSRLEKGGLKSGRNVDEAKEGLMRSSKKTKAIPHDRPYCCLMSS